jgi:hypothetical protein
MKFQKITRTEVKNKGLNHSDKYGWIVRHEFIQGKGYVEQPPEILKISEALLKCSYQNVFYFPVILNRFNKYKVLQYGAIIFTGTFEQCYEHVEVWKATKAKEVFEILDNTN